MIFSSGFAGWGWEALPLALKRGQRGAMRDASGNQSAHGEVLPCLPVSPCEDCGASKDADAETPRELAAGRPLAFVGTGAQKCCRRKMTVQGKFGIAKKKGKADDFQTRFDSVYFEDQKT